MTATESQIQPAPQPGSTVSAATPSATNPYVGVLGVFLGAGLATLNGRLLSVGLADLRGALGFGIDEASWIPTALNMAAMLGGIFVVFLNFLFGTRKILLWAATIFMAVSVLLPFASSYQSILALEVIAGLTSGTFYTLTMTFVLTALPKRLIILGIAAYASDIIFVSNIASLLEGWFVEHLSWHWIFWTAATVTPLMLLCIYFGISDRPRAPSVPSWRGFAYFSAALALLYGALDQGERLDWLNSGIVVALFAAGGVLLAATLARRLIQPNPIFSISFLLNRNTIILALAVFVFKFVQLSTVVLVPGFLGNTHGYRPLETGAALAWVAVPMLAFTWLAAWFVVRTEARLSLALGLSIVAVCALAYSRLDPAWAGNSFITLELVIASGFAFAFVGVVGSIVLQAIETGAVTSVAFAVTISGFVHLIRLFGGQVGVSWMTHYISMREKVHSNLVGLHVQAGDWLADDRVRALTGGLLPASSGPEEARQRAIGILGGQVRAQAYTMAIADSFILIACVVVAYLLLMLILRPAKVSFKALRSMS